jgi:hypothetical protein
LDPLVPLACNSSLHSKDHEFKRLHCSSHPHQKNSTALTGSNSSSQIADEKKTTDCMFHASRIPAKLIHFFSSFAFSRSSAKKSSLLPHASRLADPGWGQKVG